MDMDAAAVCDRATRLRVCNDYRTVSNAAIHPEHPVLRAPVKLIPVALVALPTVALREAGVNV